MATQDFAEAFRGLGVLSCSCRRAVLFASVVDDPEAHPEKYWDDQTFWTPSLHYFNSFSLALYSGPLSGAPGFRANLTMVTRSALIPNYRSDAMHLERLHWEAAVDRPPEALAAELRDHFTSAQR